MAKQDIPDSTMHLDSERNIKGMILSTCTSCGTMFCANLFLLFICLTNQSRCQERALREMGEAASANVRMTQLASLVDDSYNSNLKGLMDNFSPAAMRLRRLTGGADGPADVDEITFSEFNVTDGVGGLRSAAVAIGSYTGNQLQADTASTATVTSDISATFDFSSFDNPSSRRLNPLNPLDGSFVARRAHRAAAVPFLAGLNRPSDEFLQVAPTSLTPEIALGSPGGTSENPFMLDCDGPLANTWEEYLDDNEEDETTGAFQRTSLEQQAEVIVREKIICGQIPISVTLVNNPGFTNVFEDVYELLGNSQAISLIQPNSRRLVSAPIADFSSVTVRAISAEAFCSYFEWEFQVYATDGTTNTNTISVFARLQCKWTNVTQWEGSAIDQLFLNSR